MPDPSDFRKPAAAPADAEAGPPRTSTPWEDDMDDIDWANIAGPDIRRIRKRFGLTQTDLARWLPLPNPDEGGKTTVARWETGRKLQPYIGRAFRDLVAELEAKGLQPRRPAKPKTAAELRREVEELRAQLDQARAAPQEPAEAPQEPARAARRGRAGADGTTPAGAA